MKTSRFRTLLFGFIVGLMCAVFLRPALAQIGLSWSRDQVVAVVLVKPSFGGFEPVNGTSIGNTWTKDEVKPMCQVKPSVIGFVPVAGSSIGNSWTKGEVKPLIFVEPFMGVFVPTRN